VRGVRTHGHADPADLFSWAGAAASLVNRTDPGGSRGLGVQAVAPDRIDEAGIAAVGAAKGTAAPHLLKVRVLFVPSDADSIS
jgi:hypothetical protein